MTAAGRDCFEVVRPFLAAMAGTAIPYQVLGGISVLPFVHGSPAVDGVAGRVAAAPRLHLSTLRDNGSRRDLDILVLSTSSALVDATRAIAARTIGGELETSVFALRPAAQLRQQAARPLAAAGRIFLGDRYVEEDAGRVSRLFRALFPFAVEVGTGALQTWQVDLGDHLMPIQRPGSLLGSYLTRSVSGLRPKDHAKVAALADAVTRLVPDEIRWLTAGEGGPLLELARILHTLRETRPLAVGPLTLAPLARGELGVLDACIVRGAPPATRELVLAVTVLKARILHRLERSERVVAMWQRRGFEERVSGIIHNAG